MGMGTAWAGAGFSKVVDRTESLLGAAWAPCVCGLVAGHVGFDLYNAIGIQLNLIRVR